MIKYAGAPQLGDYVIINDKPESVRMVTTIVMNVDTAVKYWLDNNSIIGFEQEDLTRVKPEWNIGELVRYKGKVYKVQNVTVRNYKFVYTLDDKDWVAENDLEAVNDIRHSLRSDDWISINKYCIYEQFKGMKGRINIISHLGANCFLRGTGPQSYDISWEAIDVEEKKVEPYNAKLICIESNDCAWNVGDIAIVKDSEMYFIDEDTRKKLFVAENVDCLDAVNKFFPRVTFAEIKETIGDKMVAIGDLVIIHFDLEYVKVKIESLKYWDSSMSMYLSYEGNIGRVVEIKEDGAIQVEFEDGLKWWFPIYCMCKTAETFSF